MTRRDQCFGAFVLVVALAVASSASAGVFQMSGQWIQNRGPQVDIPVVPGFIPGMGPITATGSNPADFTVKPNRFVEVGNGALFPLPGITLIQLTTMLDAMGPEFAGMFFNGPKGSRPANFAWCPSATPGMGVQPACPNGGFNAGIGRPGIVRYTAGPNQFGGTMQMLLVGSGSVSVLGGPATGMGGQPILHNPFGGGGASNDQEAGGVFQNTGTVMLAAGDITLQTMGIPPGVITMPGPIIGMGPTEFNYTTGFPWTTGMVQGTNPTATTIAPPSGTMLTLTGMDSRTMLGAGNIVMVAGGLTKRQNAGTTFIHLDIVNMTTSPMTVPSMSRGAFAAAAVLVLAAGYVLRRRLA
jgi:hypothetical protein